jgi:hypothetical protein
VPRRADLEGVVRSRITGRGVSGAQVWAAGTPWAAVTDSAGRFRLSALSGSGFTLFVRLCDRTVADSLRMLFNPARPIHPELLVDGVPYDCPAPRRPPWAVDRSDPILEGYYIQSSEGSPFLSCANETLLCVVPRQQLGTAGSTPASSGRSALRPATRTPRQRPDPPRQLRAVRGRGAGGPGTTPSRLPTPAAADPRGHGVGAAAAGPTAVRSHPAHGIHCTFDALALLRNRRAAASSGRS